MGEVYRARDTRLDREVAIKVSAERFSERFDREARVVASLNHPNICALYDVGPNYLVMELIEGESPKGPLPLATVIDYAKQLAAALDAAHEKGITHRDLKPGNLKVTPDGRLKVLDFGLAKLTAPGPEVPLEHSPTIVSGVTQAGLILGTAAYMSPEQAKGRAVDKRADIWAFGVVLYELVTGKALFHGDDVTDVLASVLRDQPNLEELPPQLAPLIKNCLQKDSKLRLRDIADSRLLLDPPVAAAPVLQEPGRSSVMPWIAAAVLGVAALVFAYLWLRPGPPPELTRFQIHAPPGMTLPLGTPAVSPDGRSLAYVVSDDKHVNRIHLQRLDKEGTTILPGTENAMHPFWSPDGASLAFVSNNVMKRIDIAGGSPRTLIEGVTGPWHGDWGENDDILFTSINLNRLSARGSGASKVVLPSAGGHPAFLPGGIRFLFRSQTESKTAIRLSDLNNPKADGPVVVEADSAPTLARTPKGTYLLYLQEPDLFAVEFDVKAGTIQGSPFVLIPHIGQVASPPVKPAVGVSRNGVMAYQAGGFDAGILTWFDRAGKSQGTIAVESGAQWLRFSPNGSQVASRQSGDFWIIDLARGASTRLTRTGRNSGGAWSPDGKQLAFGRENSKMFAVNVDGSGEVAMSENAQTPRGWSADGFIMLRVSDLLFQPKGNAKPVALTNGMAANNPAFSPDGKFVAYAARPSTRPEVFIQALPPGNGRIQVSLNGGNAPRWRGDGHELFFLTPSSTIMAVDVQTGEKIQAGIPHELFTPLIGDVNAWDVTPDGKRFLVWQGSNIQTDNPITVVLNWWVGLR